MVKEQSRKSSEENDIGREPPYHAIARKGRREYSQKNEDGKLDNRLFQQTGQNTLASIATLSESQAPRGVWTFSDSRALFTCVRNSIASIRLVRNPSAQMAEQEL